MEIWNFKAPHIDTLCSFQFPLLGLEKAFGLPAVTLTDMHISFAGKGGHDDYSSWHSVFGEHHLWDNRQRCSEGVRGVTWLVKSYCSEFLVCFSPMFVWPLHHCHSSQVDMAHGGACSSSQQLSTTVKCIFNGSAVFSVTSVNTIRKKRSKHK